MNLKCHALWPRHVFELATGGGFINWNNGSLLNNNWPLSPCTYSLFRPSTIASNDNNKCKQEGTEEELAAAVKGLKVFDDDNDDNSFDESSKEMEVETEVEDISSEEELMNQPDSSEEKLMR
jgi:hypothetical protein